jgi:hypothetical protein
VPLTYDQFRYGFANAVSEEEAKQLYEEFAVPASGKALWQAALANLNPWTEDKVDTKNPDRGPLLLISGELDHTVPPAIVNASYKQQQDNPGVTEIEKIPGHGHALTIDSVGVRPPTRPSRSSSASPRVVVAIPSGCRSLVRPPPRAGRPGQRPLWGQVQGSPTPRPALLLTVSRTAPTTSTPTNLSVRKRCNHPLRPATEDNSAVARLT